MDWSQRRKIFYAAMFAGIIILLAAYPTYRLVHRAPTCFDGSKNGAETGVDCGGGCALVCVVDTKPLRTVWAKVFPINSTSYDLGAYVENPNTNAGLKRARYIIHVLDSDAKVLAEKTGEVEIAPASTNLIFETGLTFSGAPDRVEISFNGDDLTKWTRATTASSPVATKNQSLTATDTKPRFDAVLVNTDPVNDVTGITLGAIIYDASRNPVAVSRTYVDSIPPNGEQNIFFTWPHTFAGGSQNFLTEIIITPHATFAQ